MRPSSHETTKTHFPLAGLLIGYLTLPASAAITDEDSGLEDNMTYHVC
ncbi:MAG: hypothetical protein KIT56_01365 [Gammaproteobacteria bacterium]|nr:hypothetical protein [Gammaproteobacteria bacterium]